MATLSTLPAGDLGPQHLFLAVEVPHSHAGSDEVDVLGGQLVAYHRDPLEVELQLGMHMPRTVVTVPVATMITLVDAPADQRPIVGWGS